MSERKGISLSVVNQMFDIEDKAMQIVDRIFTTNDREEKLLLDDKLSELEKSLKPLSKIVTIGKTKHSEEYNSVLVLDIVKRYSIIPRERLYNVIEILTEEELI